MTNLSQAILFPQKVKDMADKLTLSHLNVFCFFPPDKSCVLCVGCCFFFLIRLDSHRKIELLELQEISYR